MTREEEPTQECKMATACNTFDEVKDAIAEAILGIRHSPQVYKSHQL